MSCLRLTIAYPGVCISWNRPDNCKTKCRYHLLDQMLLYLHPILVQLKLSICEKIHEVIVEGNDMVLKKRFRENIKKRMLLTFQSNNFKRLELGLETIFQLSAQVALLALAASDTRTSHGLVSVFKGSKVLFIPADVYVCISILISVGSFAWAQSGGIAGRRVYFPLKSKFMIGLSALMACLIRVTAFVLFFSPSLGLWNLLRHYQGTQKIKLYKQN